LPGQQYNITTGAKGRIVFNAQNNTYFSEEKAAYFKRSTKYIRGQINATFRIRAMFAAAFIFIIYGGMNHLLLLVFQQLFVPVGLFSAPATPIHSFTRRPRVQLFLFLAVFLIRFNWLVFLFIFAKYIYTQENGCCIKLSLAFGFAHGDDDKWR